MAGHVGDDALHDDIEQIEARIEALTESIERCRKISFVSKLTVAAGALWFALMVLWIVPFSPTGFVAALAAVLGGIVLLGSNSTTWMQADTDLDVAETMRAQLIGKIDLRMVGEETRTIH